MFNLPSYLFCLDFLFWVTGCEQDTESIPIPKVIIDQDSDSDATVVEITFGDRLGALLDTV